ncbi:MAG: hypothetical protein QOC80_2509 [Frankiaceae bacterium]|nr:hypothetical protein [Frankiaceae bacterium]
MNNEPARRFSLRAVSVGAGAMAPQAINALSSLALQVLAARQLGVDGFAAFVLLFGVLVLLTSLQGPFIGDSLVLFDRADPGVRGSLLLLHLGLVGLLGSAAFVVPLALGLLGVGGALLFAVLTATWLTEETFRRLFVARVAYWSLTANDLCYVGITLVGVATALALGRPFSLITILVAMLIGSASSVVIAVAQLPADETRLVRLSFGAVREIVDFAVWRAMQAGLRPLAMLTMRLAVLGFAGAAAVSLVEAGRLLIAPAQAVVQAATGLVFTQLAAQQRGARPTLTAQQTQRALVAMTVLTGVVAVAFAPALGRLLASDAIPVGRAIVAAWVGYTVVLALSTMVNVRLLVRKQSRVVFLARLADSAVGLLLVVVACAAHAFELVPVALAVSLAGSTIYLRRLVSRSATVPGAAPRAVPVGLRP